MSFADLTLVLLAFFVMIHARSDDADRIVQGIGAALGPQSARTRLTGQAADALFEPGEAVFRPEGKAALAAATKGWAREGRVIVTSTGQSPAGRRFDTWELSAARAAAVARQIAASGIPASAIDIDMDPARRGPAHKAQTITIAHLPH